MVDVTDAEKTWYDRVYAAKTEEETAAAYAGWAATYEADLYEAGYRGPPLAAALLSRYAPEGDDPILDAAAGTGMVGDLIALLGFENVTGIDLSADMLKVAEGKGVYSELRTMRLGEALDFADDHFAATLIVGALTPGHAPPESLYELVRVTRPGGSPGPVRKGSPAARVPASTHRRSASPRNGRPRNPALRRAAWCEVRCKRPSLPRPSACPPRGRCR